LSAREADTARLTESLLRGLAADPECVTNLRPRTRARIAPQSGDDVVSDRVQLAREFGERREDVEVAVSCAATPSERPDDAKHERAVLLACGVSLP
jgi:hypothetical protein